MELLVSSPVSTRLRAFVRDDLRVALLPWVLARVLSSEARSPSPGSRSTASPGPTRPVQLGQGLFAWDAAFYRDIAEHGYRALPDAALRFFPLVPMLGRGLGSVLLDHNAAALLIVANVSALLFGALLHRLALRETGDAGSRAGLRGSGRSCRRRSRWCSGTPRPPP